VRRFVEASILGWANYLYGDRKAADAMIRKLNPETTQDELDNTVLKMRELGLVDSGDARTQGIGAINPTKVKDFHDKMVKAGLLKDGEVDLTKVYTTQFVNKGLGVDVIRKLTGAGK
ncbi:MAG: ABC transporter substrate-binding protein, partial [Burkholderiales bacterium]